MSGDQLSRQEGPESRPQSSVEWRVIWTGLSGDVIAVDEFKTESAARSFANETQAEYPHHGVIIEHRVVGPWRRDDD